MGKEPKFVGGLRYTDRETMDVVQMVLAGKINKGLSSLSNSTAAGQSAFALDGGMIKAVKMKGEQDLGLVGDITKLDVTLIRDVLTAAQSGYCDRCRGRGRRGGLQRQRGYRRFADCGLAFG